VLPCKKKKATGSPIPPLCKHFKLLVLQSWSYILYEGNTNVKRIMKIFGMLQFIQNSETYQSNRNYRNIFQFPKPLSYGNMELNPPLHGISCLISIGGL
jgi:hypothetical protein